MPSPYMHGIVRLRVQPAIGTLRPAAHGVWPDMPVKKIGGGVIGLEPGRVKKKNMNFIRKTICWNGTSYARSASTRSNHFLEGNIAVIVALNQQHG